MSRLHSRLFLFLRDAGKKNFVVSRPGSACAVAQFISPRGHRFDLRHPHTLSKRVVRSHRYCWVVIKTLSFSLFIPSLASLYLFVASAPILRDHGWSYIQLGRSSLIFTFTFTFLCIYQTFLSKATYIAFKLQFLHFCQLFLSLGIEPMILALLAPCSTI